MDVLTLSKPYEGQCRSGTRDGQAGPNTMQRAPMRASGLEWPHSSVPLNGKIFIPMQGLQSEWRYYQLAGSEQSQRSWADSLKMVGKATTVPELLYTLDETEKRGMENINDPNLFNGAVLPMWEDAANVNGGRCILEVPMSQRDALHGLWRTTVAFCCSGIFDSINGCVFNEKTYYRISIWISDPRENELIIKAWRDVLQGGQLSFSFALHNKYTDYSKNKKKHFSKK